MTPTRRIQDLLDIMARLRSPGTGCPWDLEQTFRTIAPYTLEEAYEVVDAIEREDFADLADELGDLLLQVVFHAQMAKEAKLFDFDDVVERISAKLIRRHPHVFGDALAEDSDAVLKTWNAVKADEKKERAQQRGATQPHSPGLLNDAPRALPALVRAIKLQAKASTIGFDWNDPRKALEKIREETDEIEAALEGAEHCSIEDEIGDLFFALANLARHLKIDPEQATRAANAKFMRRFAHIEKRLAGDEKRLGEASLAEMDALWDEAKTLEREKTEG